MPDKEPTRVSRRSYVKLGAGLMACAAFLCWALGPLSSPVTPFKIKPDGTVKVLDFGLRRLMPGKVAIQKSTLHPQVLVESSANIP
jgi:hypothetical protein